MMCHFDPQTYALGLARRWTFRGRPVPASELEEAHKRLSGSGWCVCKEGERWAARPASQVEGIMLASEIESGGVYLDGKRHTTGG